LTTVTFLIFFDELVCSSCWGFAGCSLHVKLKGELCIFDVLAVSWRLGGWLQEMRGVFFKRAIN